MAADHFAFVAQRLDQRAQLPQIFARSPHDLLGVQQMDIALVVATLDQQPAHLLGARAGVEGDDDIASRVEHAVLFRPLAHGASCVRVGTT